MGGTSAVAAAAAGGVVAMVVRAVEQVLGAQVGFFELLE